MKYINNIWYLINISYKSFMTFHEFWLVFLQLCEEDCLKGQEPYDRLLSEKYHESNRLTHDISNKLGPCCLWYYPTDYYCPFFLNGGQQRIKCLTHDLDLHDNNDGAVECRREIWVWSILCILQNGFSQALWESIRCMPTPSHFIVHSCGYN